MIKINYNYGVFILAYSKWYRRYAYLNRNDLYTVTCTVHNNITGHVQGMYTIWLIYIKISSRVTSVLFNVVYCTWGQFHKTILRQRSVLRPKSVLRSIIAVSQNCHILSQLFPTFASFLHTTGHNLLNLLHLKNKSFFFPPPCQTTEKFGHRFIDILNLFTPICLSVCTQTS